MKNKHLFNVFLLLSLLIILILPSKAICKENIEELLKEYLEAETYQTADETLGKVYVFSREDIENLQLNTIADLMKLIPFGTTYPNGFGVIQWNVATEPTSHIQTAVRIYLDGHELSSIHTLSPFLTYDEFPLDNIQKIEVYFTNAMSDKSVENGTIIVKLYSKDPKKENISLIKGLLDNKRGYSTTFSDARQVSDEFGYFILVNKGKKNYDKLSVNSHNIDRNQDRQHLYMKFTYIDTEIQISASSVKRGIWGGFSTDFSPDYGKAKSTDVFFSLSQKMLEDKSLKLLVSYDWQKRNYIEKNIDFGVPYLKYKSQYGLPVYMNEDSTFSKFILYAEKSFNFGFHFLNLGITVQDYKQAFIGKNITYKNNKVIDDFESPYEESDIFSSLIFDYRYKANKNLNLFVNGKLSHYNWYHNKDSLIFDKRIGLICKRDKFRIKSFISQAYTPPPLIYIETKKEDLKPVKVNLLYLEGKYNISDNQSIDSLINYTTVYNTFEFTPKGFVSSSKKFESYLFSLGYNLDLLNTKLRAEGWYIYSASYDDLSPPAGINIILNGSEKNINYFATLLYRNSFKYKNVKIKDSYDLSLGAGYEFENGFSVKVRGENILNSSPEAIYIKPSSAGVYRGFDRRFLITLEKVF